MGEERVIRSARAPRGVIITHGRLGEELKRTAELVVGHSEGIEAFSNSDLSITALTEQMKSLVASEPMDLPILFFVDLLGGSCGQACTEFLAQRPGSRLFTGVNLPMVIAFLQYRETMDPEELAQGILMRAHRGITAFPVLTALAEAKSTEPV